MPRRDVALAAFVVLVWGVNFVAANLGMETYPPLLLAALRFTLVALPAVFFVKPPGNGWKTVVAVGLAMSALQFALLYTAMMLGMPAGLASLVMQVQTVFTVVIASVVLGEHPSRMQVAGIAIGVFGMAVVGWQYISAAPAFPFLLTVGSAAAWASGNVLTRRRPPRSGFSLVVWSALVAPLPLLGLSWVFDGPERIAHALLHPTPRAVLGLAFVTYGASMIGYGIWNLLLSRHAAATVAPWSMFVPVIGAGAAWFYNGELPSVLGVIGGAITVVGVLLALGVGATWLRRGRAEDDTPDLAHPPAEPAGL